MFNVEVVSGRVHDLTQAYDLIPHGSHEVKTSESYVRDRCDRWLATLKDFACINPTKRRNPLFLFENLKLFKWNIAQIVLVNKPVRGTALVNTEMENLDSRHVNTTRLQYNYIKAL